jgi:flagellin
MGLDINTNVAALESERNLSSAQNALSMSFNRLSSGYRINSSADDAAGLAISDSMQMQIRSYTVAERNANDAISMAQTADGALSSVTDILGRMRELATEGANGDLQSTDRSYLETEFSSLQSEIKRIMTATQFNGQQLIANSASSPVQFQVGINNVTTDRITVTFGKIGLTSLVSASTTLSGLATNSQATLDTIDSALTNVSTARARFGAVVNRLNVTVSNIETESTNLSAANSRIRDVDVASETANLSREQVLEQAGVSVLAQANQSPQLALKLLG